MVELEKKLLLTKEEFNSLLLYFGNEKQRVKQVNYYFDTEDLSMNRQGVTCRIRLKNGTYTATMKQHTNFDRSTETKIDIRNGLDDNAFIDMGLTLQGELVTNRCVILKNAVCEAVLDQNDYLGYTDYELEIEYLTEHEADADAIMQACLRVLKDNIPVLSSNDMPLCCNKVPSKSARFFERKAKYDIHT